VKALAAAALLLAAGLAQAQVSVQDDAVVFRGQINARSAAEFLLLVNDPRVTRLVITSGGGDVAAALDMAAVVHERALDIEVPHACHSSCANYVFPAARQKLLGHAAAVAWHGNISHVLHLQQTGQATWSDAQVAAAVQLAQREEAFYRRIAVDGFIAWFAKIAPYAVPGFYFLSVEDMARFGIGNVTVRAPARRDGSQLVAVDWASLDALRPVIRLQP
jgi:hypothetical protein